MLLQAKRSVFTQDSPSRAKSRLSRRAAALSVSRSYLKIPRADSGAGRRGDHRASKGREKPRVCRLWSAACRSRAPSAADPSVADPSLADSGRSARNQGRLHPTTSGRCDQESLFWKFWRPGPESNRRTRICNPLHNHSATGPRQLPASVRKPWEAAETRGIKRPIIRVKRSSAISGDR